MWGKIYAHFKQSWEELINNLQEYIKEQIKEAGMYTLEKLEEPGELYKSLGGSKVLISFLKDHDRNPEDDTLDLFPWVPERIEIFVFSRLIKKAFYGAVTVLYRTLKEEMEDMTKHVTNH
jgi:hypothetical protein